MCGLQITEWRVLAAAPYYMAIILEYFKNYTDWSLKKPSWIYRLREEIICYPG